MRKLDTARQITLLRDIPAVTWDVHTDAGIIEILPMSKKLLMRYAGLTGEKKAEEGAWVISDPEVISGGIFDKLLQLGYDVLGRGNTKLPLAQSTSDHKAQEWYLNRALHRGSEIRLVKINKDGRELDVLTTRVKGFTAHPRG